MATVQNTNFHLKVASREGVIYEGGVTSITSYNEKGTFDVLASHAHFISLIKKKVTIREKEGGSVKEIPFDIALMRVKDNRVEVYVGVEGMSSSANVVN